MFCNQIYELSQDLRDGMIAAVMLPFVVIWLVGGFILWIGSWGFIDVDLVYPMILIIMGLQGFGDIPGLTYQIVKELADSVGDCLNPKLISYLGDDLKDIIHST